MKLSILSGGAALGLVDAVRARFESEAGCQIAGEFGAVGAMKEKLLAGADCDIVILSRKLVDELAGAGQVQPGRSDEQTAELQTIMRKSYAGFGLKTKK